MKNLESKKQKKIEPSKYVHERSQGKNLKKIPNKNLKKKIEPSKYIHERRQSEDEHDMPRERNPAPNLIQLIQFCNNFILQIEFNSIYRFCSNISSENLAGGSRQLCQF